VECEKGEIIQVKKKTIRQSDPQELPLLFVCRKKKQKESSLNQKRSNDQVGFSGLV